MADATHKAFTCFNQHSLPCSLPRAFHFECLALRQPDYVVHPDLEQTGLKFKILKLRVLELQTGDCKSGWHVHFKTEFIIHSGKHHPALTYQTLSQIGKGNKGGFIRLYGHSRMVWQAREWKWKRPSHVSGASNRQMNSFSKQVAHSQIKTLAIWEIRSALHWESIYPPPQSK